ncbi:MAG: fatty acid desaturase [Planctomycetota bacterium]|nr:fatty acid desaturase [Planctomycetota bacterium]
MLTPRPQPWWKTGFAWVFRWFDSEAGRDAQAVNARWGWLNSLPYLAMHAMCLGIIWVGISPIAVIVAVAFFALRMFVVTAFYHRYFSHRSYKLNRFWQFVAGLLGTTCVQRGPLWWAAHHRHHHRYSDEPEDTHSPVQRGFWYSHVGWILDPKNNYTHVERVPDLAKFPELRFLDRFCVLIAVATGAGMYYLGKGLAAAYPELGTSAGQMLIWGFFVSTVFLHHATFTINSLSHVWGKRKYETTDDSRNNWMLAILTFGEGWHNNHHHYQASTRQGWRWYEVDLTFYILKLLSFVGIVKGMKRVPDRVRERTAKVVRAERIRAERAGQLRPEPVAAGDSVTP